MTDRAIVGIDPKNGNAEIIASMRPDSIESNLAEIEKHGFLAVITTKEKAKEVWGDSIDPFDLLIA